MGLFSKLFGKKEKKAEVVATTVVEETPVTEKKVEKKVDSSVDSKRRIPFTDKIGNMDEKTKEYVNAINNKFKSLRNINMRVSSRGVSYRNGRELIAKMTIRGKALKLHLALDPKAFDENIYFQKDLSNVKTHVEVPFTVKVKSDRGFKNAMKLIDALIENKGIESKTRFVKADLVGQLVK
ncbi:MAG: hypothetical protein E7373_01915 [Clostridiales bacterium]|nr:hypothetical protein [Clostridiales bacterium]